MSLCDEPSVREEIAFKMYKWELKEAREEKAIMDVKVGIGIRMLFGATAVVVAIAVSVGFSSLTPLFPLCCVEQCRKYIFLRSIYIVTTVSVC